MPAHEHESDTTTDPLARERAHLTASRAALRAMREDAQALDIRDVTANWVNAAVLQAQIDERIKSLADLAHTPLFFGRLDYLHRVGAEQAEGAEESSSTSGAAMSTTPTATRWSSTGARPSRSRSTGRPGRTPRTWGSAAGSATPAVS